MYALTIITKLCLQEIENYLEKGLNKQLCL